MNGMKKRITAIMLCFAVVLTTLAYAPAAKAANYYPENLDDFFAYIDSIEYPEDLSQYIQLSGIAHVQNYGNVKGKVVKQNGIPTLVLGTRGQSKRVEKINIKLDTKNMEGITGRLEYRVHIQKLGWTGWIPAGQAAGTEGMSYRLEGIQMRLTGELGQVFDVRYRAHIQNYGDNQGWVYNGALAGTTGESKRLEEIQVQIIPKGYVKEKPSVSYRVHREKYGWESVWAKDGEVSGTTGESKRLEGITITINDNYIGGGVEYTTHVQNYGWMDPVANGWMSGTQGESKRLEAIRIILTGNLANVYDIYYRVHAQNEGWMGWAKNGEMAGTEGGSKRLEAIQICLKRKDEAAPPTTYKNVTQDVAYAYRKYEPDKSRLDREFAEEVLRLTNIERAKEGIAPLVMKEDMYDLACERAIEQDDYWSHTRPDGRSCFTIMTDNGITYFSAGENIAYGQISPKKVIEAWMNSPGHRRNIMNPNFKEMGVGCYKDKNGRLYWEQLFVTRR